MSLVNTQVSYIYSFQWEKISAESYKIIETIINLMNVKSMTETLSTKQVIVIRKDLKMGIGKIASQACHACLEASKEAEKYNPRIWKIWHNEGSKKVIVKVNSLEELLDIKEKATLLEIPNALIIDRGLTQIQPNTPTALGIGPAKKEVIDKLTKHLKLL